jgi:uncharacterized membrane protein YfcA
MTWFAAVIGLVAGVFSGLLGIGGGVIVVPMLVLLLGLSMREATGTSLAALMLPVGLLGVLVYYKEGVIRLPISALLAVGLMVGVYFGSHWNSLIPETYLRRGFALLLCLLALQLFLKR